MAKHETRCTRASRDADGNRDRDDSMNRIWRGKRVE